MEEQNKQTAPEQEAPAPAPAAAPQPQPQVIQQYVTTERSVKGIGGWLIFWIVVFVLAGIGLLSTFANLLSGLESGSTGETVIGLIFSPILAVGWLASAVFIIMQRKLAVMVTLATFGVAALYGVISAIVTYASSGGDTPIAVFIVGILIGLIIEAAMASYFVVSKRVKQTLVK